MALAMLMGEVTTNWINSRRTAVEIESYRKSSVLQIVRDGQDPMNMESMKATNTHLQSEVARAALTGDMTNRDDCNIEIDYNNCHRRIGVTLQKIKIVGCCHLKYVDTENFRNALELF